METRKEKNAKTTSSRSKRRESAKPTAFFNHLNFTLLKMGLGSHKPVNTRSSPTDLVRSDTLTTLKFQSGRRYVDRCSHSCPLKWNSVQFDPVRLRHITKNPAWRTQRPYQTSNSQGSDKVLHIVRGYHNCHRNGYVVGNHLKSLVALWGGQKFSHDDARVRYVNMAYAVVG